MSAAAYGNVCSRECVNTEFVWEFKRGFVKMVVSRAFQLRECLLGELPLYLKDIFTLEVTQVIYVTMLNSFSMKTSIQLSQDDLPNKLLMFHISYGVF